MLPLLEAEGIALVGVSYDPVNVLARFADEHGITYPLLSDVGSVEISRLGLRDDEVHLKHARYGIEPHPRHQGVPFPGTFLLDGSGVVVDKVFHASYRERDTGSGLLDRFFGVDEAVDGPALAGELGPIAVSLRFDSADYASWQRLTLLVELTMADDWHVIAAPAPGGYTPLTVEIDAHDGIVAGEAGWPVPVRFTSTGIAGDVLVHEGSTIGRVPVTFELPGGSGPVTLRGRVHLQACSATECLIPGIIPFELTVAEGEFLRPGRRRS